MSTKREGSVQVSGTQTGRFGADGSQGGMQRRHHLCALTDCCGNAFKGETKGKKGVWVNGAWADCT